MKFEFDPDKNVANIAKHSVDMARAEVFEFDTAQVMVDGRRDYGETRYVGIGYIHGRLHYMTFTLRRQVIRVIGLRKANLREQRRFLNAQT